MRLDTLALFPAQDFFAIFPTLVGRECILLPFCHLAAQQGHLTTLPKLAMLHPGMEAAVQPAPVPAKAIRHGVVLETKPEGDKTACRFN